MSFNQVRRAILQALKRTMEDAQPPMVWQSVGWSTLSVETQKRWVYEISVHEDLSQSDFIHVSAYTYPDHVTVFTESIDPNNTDSLQQSVNYCVRRIQDHSRAR